MLLPLRGGGWVSNFQKKPYVTLEAPKRILRNQKEPFAPLNRFISGDLAVVRQTQPRAEQRVSFWLPSTTRRPRRIVAAYRQAVPPRHACEPHDKQHAQPAVYLVPLGLVGQLGRIRVALDAGRSKWVERSRPMFIRINTYYRPLSRRLDRCDRVIQNQSRHPNGGNVRLFSAVTSMSQCKLRSLCAMICLSALFYTFRESLGSLSIAMAFSR